MSLANDLRNQSKKECRAEAAKEKRRAELELADSKWRLDKFVAEELPKLPATIKKWAKDSRSHHYAIHKSELRDEYAVILSKFAHDNGLKFEMRSEWCRAESPDPDSGEGGSEAGPIYIFTLSW